MRGAKVGKRGGCNDLVGLVSNVTSKVQCSVWVVPSFFVRAAGPEPGERASKGDE